MSLIAFNGPLYHKLAAFLPILPCFSYCNNIPSFYNYANYASLSRWNLCFHHFEPTLVTNIIAKTRAFLVPILVNDLPWSHSRPANASYHVSKLASRLQISPWQHHHPGFNCLSIPPGTIINLQLPSPVEVNKWIFPGSWLVTLRCAQLSCSLVAALQNLQGQCCNHGFLTHGDSPLISSHASSIIDYQCLTLAFFNYNKLINVPHNNTASPNSC